MQHSLHLSEDTQKVLERIVRASTSPVRQVFRARILLLAGEGKSYSAISKILGTTLITVRKWITRFHQDLCLKSLEDAPRSGRPHTIPAAAKCEVIKFACSDVRTHAISAESIWTIKSLQQCVENSIGIFISKSEINRILNNGALRPHKVKMWLHSPDPFFREKVTKIASLYLDPPQDAIVLCVDEKSGMQAIERTRSLAPKSKGCVVRIDTEYKRHGTQTLIGAFEPHTGKVFGHCGNSRKKEDIMNFMEEVAIRYPTQQVYIVWDNLNIHCGYRWYEFNKRHGDRFHFVYTPVHGSWVNQIEIWFGILQRKVLKNNSFKSEEELRLAVLEFIDDWNKEKCHPFKWQYRGFQEKAA
jgi:transposase